jgi:hypothetical protein
MAKDNQPQISVPLRGAVDSTKVKRFYSSGNGSVNTTGFGEYISQSNNVANDDDTGNLASKLANAGAIGSIGATLAAITGRVGVNAAYSKGLSLLKPVAKTAYGAAAVARKAIDIASRKEVQVPIKEIMLDMSAKGLRSGSTLGKAANWRNVIVGDRALGSAAKLAKFAKYSKFMKWAGPLATVADVGISAVASNAALHGKYDEEKLPRYNTGEMGEEVKGYRIGSRAGLVNPSDVGNNILGTAAGFVHGTASMFDGVSSLPGKAAKGLVGLVASDETASKYEKGMDGIVRSVKGAFGIKENPLNPLKKVTSQLTVDGDPDVNKVYGNDMRGRMMADLFVRAKMRGMEGVPNSYTAVNEAEAEAAKLYKEGKLEKAALDQTPAEIFYNPSKERGYNKDPMMNMAAYYPGDDRYPVYMHTLRQAYAEKHAGNNPKSPEYKKFEQVFDSYLSSTATNRGRENETIRDEIRKEAFDYYHQKRKAAAEKRYEPIKK